MAPYVQIKEPLGPSSCELKLKQVIKYSEFDRYIIKMRNPNLIDVFSLHLGVSATQPISLPLRNNSGSMHASDGVERE